MEIITKRLILKPSDPLYPDSACDYLTSADNARFMMHLPASSREEVLQLLTNAKHEWAKAEPSFYEFVILLGGIHVGGISIFLQTVTDMRQNSDGLSAAGTGIWALRMRLPPVSSHTHSVSGASGSLSHNATVKTFPPAA